MARKCFYSFHYKPDNWRAAQVRGMGVIEGNQPVSDNDWETVTKGSDPAIAKWIEAQMYGKSCTIVLVGSETANRKWINHEIIRSWDSKMGVVGIRIHGLKNKDERISKPGENPFDFIGYGNTGKKLSSIVNLYDPPGATSKERYSWISKYLAAAVEEAIEIRKKN